jgi:hypothetical protein
MFSSYQPDHQTLMMEIEMVLEMSVLFNQLTLLIAREDFVDFSRRESFRAYINTFAYLSICIIFRICCVKYYFSGLLSDLR